MGLALLLRPLALDRDARQIGDLFDDALLLWRRISRFARVYREGSQYQAIRSKYRRRSTRSKPVRYGQIAILGPQWILGDIGHKYRLFAVSGRSARSRDRTDSATVDRVDIALGKARGRAVPQAIAIRIQQQNRSQRTFRQLLDKSAQGIEDHGERIA